MLHKRSGRSTDNERDSAELVEKTIRNKDSIQTIYVLVDAAEERRLWVFLAATEPPLNGPGKEVAKALAPLRQMLRAFKQTEPSPDETLIWHHKEYPRVLRQLRKVRRFNSEATADAYICGYVRGLRDAVRRNLKRNSK
jgi:hypothetical protein